MAIKSNSDGPQFVKYFGPVLQALKELGGSARPAEVRDKVAENLKISKEKIDELLDSGTSRFDNQVAWARFYLAKAGYIDSSRRGVWSLTEKGKSAELKQGEAIKIFRDVHAEFPRTTTPSQESSDADEVLAPEDSSDTQITSYRLELLDTLQSLSPGGFERFCQRLLRESGFQDVTVTGRSGDGGIDGIGILQVNPLVSFKVLFQCKRYRGTVTPSDVRDFRGAMQGRADKGIIITTGSFSSDAKKEAVRDGVPPIELLDGEKLIEMLESLELGLVPVRAFRVDQKFFEDYRV